MEYPKLDLKAVEIGYFLMKSQILEAEFHRESSL